MKVFISWSGDLSKQLGEALRIWLASTLQYVKPYFSPDDIEKGSRWESEMAKELEESDFGLICLTQENLERPWIMFEAGALAKKFGRSHVCPVLFGVATHQLLEGPLGQFQGVRFKEDEMRRLLKTLNSFCGDGELAADVLDNVFNTWWPQLNQKATGILEKAAAANPPKKASRDEVLDEILKLSRQSYELNQRIHQVIPDRSELNALPDTRPGKARARILSVLRDMEEGLGQRQICVRTGLSQMMAFLTLEELIQAGVVERMMPALKGANPHYRLRRDENEAGKDG